MSDKIENLDDYISRFKEYKSGNYECRQITSSQDIVKAVEDGEKIVFLESKVKALVFLGVSGIILIIALIVLSILVGLIPDYFLIIGVGIVSVIFGIFFLMILIPGLWYMRSPYLVLGSEGIAYKLRTGRVKGYYWEDIQMDFYNYSYIKSSSLKFVKIHILMPNGDLLKVEPIDYNCKEISMKKHSRSLYPPYLETIGLFTLIFNIYYDFGKNKTFEWQERRAEEYREKAPPLRSSMDTDIIIIDTWRDQLKEALHSYKKKNYKFGKYWTREQIQDDFLRGKVFVLKGSIGIGIWVSILIPLVLPSIAIPVMNYIYGSPEFKLDLIQILFILSLNFLIWFLCYSLLFLTLRRFIIISSSGIYYREIKRKGLFSWDEVSKINASTQESYPNPTKDLAQVEVYLISGERIRFRSNDYKNKEFSKEVYLEMFFNLFDINFRLSR